MAIYVVAEAGINHNGSFDEALRLVEYAKRSGADAVKFQLFDYRVLKRPELQRFQLSRDQIGDLSDYARVHELDFLCTPFDVAALEYVRALKPRYMKLASGAVFNEGLLSAASRLNIPIVLSTGMADWNDVDAAVDALKGCFVTMLHTTSAYPAPINEANLRAMVELRSRYGLPVGYSDHTVHGDAVVAAAALGAVYIEMHLTRSRQQSGPDHMASYEPSQFRETVARIRDMERMLGDGVKRPQNSEKLAREVWAS